MKPTFYFGEYTVRPVGPGDHAYIDTLIAADPYHAEAMDAGWFMFEGPGEDAWAIEDKQGRVVLYFKTRTAVRLFIQFGEQDSSVNRNVLKQGMEWLEGILLGNQIREVIFDTRNPVLEAMAKKRLRFSESGPGTLCKTLPSPESMRLAEGRWHHQPTASQEGG
jgi:hypothetical protein